MDRQTGESMFGMVEYLSTMGNEPFPIFSDE